MSSAWASKEEKLRRDRQSTCRDLNRSQVMIETAQQESLPSLNSCTQTNINTGLENRSLDDDEWVDFNDEAEFEIIADESILSVGEMEDEYVLL